MPDEPELDAANEKAKPLAEPSLAARCPDCIGSGRVVLLTSTRPCAHHYAFPTTRQPRVAGCQAHEPASARTCPDEPAVSCRVRVPDDHAVAGGAAD